MNLAGQILGPGTPSSLADRLDGGAHEASSRGQNWMGCCGMGRDEHDQRARRWAEETLDDHPLTINVDSDVATIKVWKIPVAEVPIEPDNVNDLYRTASSLGHQVAAYFNVNIADDPSMMITPQEGEALVSFVIGET